MFNQKRVIIVGAGFAGLHCAKLLAEERDFSVTLIDRNDYQQFQPLLYQVATGALSSQNAAFNLRSVFSEYANVQVYTSEVVSVDLENLCAMTKDGHKYDGDYLVLAAGAEVNYFKTPGAQKYSYPLYSLRDAEHLRSNLFRLLEETNLNTQERLTSELSIVVVGGGPTGVEMAGAIADILRSTPENVFANLDLAKVTVTLVNAGLTLLKPFAAASREYANRTLQERGVRVLLGKTVREVTENVVALSDGTRLPAAMVIWAGGLTATPLSGAGGIQTGVNGRIDVNDDLTIPGYTRAYAIGDFANAVGKDGNDLPQLAAVAQQAGRHCAKNIVADAGEGERTTFNYRDKGILAMIGRNAAVAELGSGHFPISGPLAYATWLGVHAALLTSFRAELEAIVEWTWGYANGAPMNPIRDEQD
jgi:NADH dehydrogenase